MKSITFLLISSIVFSNVLSCGSDGKSIIPGILHNIVSSLPELKASVSTLKGCQTSDLKPVCSKGYAYFSSIKEERLFKAIKRNGENLDAFFEILLGGLPIIESDKSKLMEILQPMRYSGFENILGMDLLYDRENVQRNNGVFFTIYVDKTCNDKKALDFLYVGIKSNFILNKEVFALEKSDKSLLGSKHSSTDMVNYEANLSRDQYKDLLDLLQLGAFADAEDMVKAFEDQF